MADSTTRKANVDSLAVLLTQGLRSQDKSILDKCLATDKERTVQATVDNLAATDAGTLLEVAVSRLDGRQGEGQTVATWIRAVLLKHTAYLMSTPAQQSNLARLQRIIEERMALVQPLTVLSGRLDLLIAQSQALRQPKAESDGNAAEPEVTLGASFQDEEMESGSEEEDESEESDDGQ